ncbi:MAG: hypothetical protein ACI9UV_001805, partial [Algoriphagus sp.]
RKIYISAEIQENEIAQIGETAFKSSEENSLRFSLPDIKSTDECHQSDPY